MTLEECPIDVVIPFVDFTDPIWRKDFESRGGILENTTVNGIERYRDKGTLRLLLKSIKKFMPWYHKIYLIVSHPSQVPDYAKDCEIILHKDFIPKDFNPPVFSSSAIETWFGNLRIGEYFVYFNDDMILTKPWSKNDCLRKVKTGDIVPRNLINIKSNCEIAEDNINGTRKEIFKLITGIQDTDQGVLPDHGPNVFKLSWCRECLKKYYDTFVERFSPVKRTTRDLNQYTYLFYQYIYHLNDQYRREGRLFRRKVSDPVRWLFIVIICEGRNCGHSQLLHSPFWGHLTQRVMTLEKGNKGTSPRSW